MLESNIILKSCWTEENYKARNVSMKCVKYHMSNQDNSENKKKNVLDHTTFRL